jgi:hypothetical protein
MASVVIHLQDQQVSALQILAQLEYRAPKVQSTLIICKAVERWGFVSAGSNGEKEQRSRFLNQGSARKELAVHNSPAVESYRVSPGPHPEQNSAFQPILGWRREKMVQKTNRTEKPLEWISFIRESPAASSQVYFRGLP